MNLSKKSKWILSILVLGCISFYAAYRYAYKPHITIENSQTEYLGSSNNFIEKIKGEAFSGYVFVPTSFVVCAMFFGVTLLGRFDKLTWSNVDMSGNHYISEKY